MSADPKAIPERVAMPPAYRRFGPGTQPEYLVPDLPHTPPEGENPGDKLRERERLAEIVIGPDAKPLHAIFDLARGQRALVAE